MKASKKSLSLKMIQGKVTKRTLFRFFDGITRIEINPINVGDNLDQTDCHGTNAMCPTCHASIEIEPRQDTHYAYHRMREERGIVTRDPEGYTLRAHHEDGMDEMYSLTVYFITPAVQYESSFCIHGVTKESADELEKVFME